MEDNPIKPDVVLVTKNVMVPVALPASTNKQNPKTSALKKKTKIVRPRQNKILARQNFPFSHDDCKRTRSKQALDTSISIDNTWLDFTYDSFLSFDRGSVEKREDRCSREFKLFQDLTCETIIKEQISSLSLPVDFATEKTPNSTCEEIVLANSSTSLVQENSLTDTMPSKSQEENNYTLDREEDGIEIFNNKSTFRNNSITEIRSRLSGESELKCSKTIARELQKTSGTNKCRIKYSWEDLENWVPPCEKKKISKADEKKSGETIPEKHLDCRIKYSWQILGTAAQTSKTLIERKTAEEVELDKACNYPCTVKYSWQIIGTGTQVSFCEYTKDASKYELDYWDGKILTTKKRWLDKPTSVARPGKCKIFYNEKTQTVAEKVLQTDMPECRVKYSWQNLTKPYLMNDKYP